MTPLRWLAAGVLLTGIALAAFAPGARAWDWDSSPTLAADGPVMPEFKHQDANSWLNSHPLKAQDLRGKVVLLEIYASG